MANKLTYEDLEQRVKDLSKEAVERKRAEETLRKRETELELMARSLEETNAALKVLLKKRDEDKADLEQKVLFNIKKLISPPLKELKDSGLDDRQNACVSVLETNLNDIVSQFSRKLSSKYMNLTPAEIQVANLVKEGKTSKEIAISLNSSVSAIQFHRNNLRNKLGLKNRKVNLRSYLLSFT
jgi:DNA-binding CsgD family transcriptional regulator